MAAKTTVDTLQKQAANAEAELNRLKSTILVNMGACQQLQQLIAEMTESDPGKE